MDISLKRLSSDKNGDMELFFSRGQYKLTTVNAVYSFGRHYRSFGHAFDKLGIHQAQNIRRVLVLGWGIGSIGDLLRGNDAIQVVTGVEHDQNLIDLYRELSDISPGLKINLVNADAINYVADSNNSFEVKHDLVCCDIFIDNLTPPSVVSVDFINGLNRICNTGGRILLSKLNMSVRDREQNNELEELLSSLGIAYDVVNTIGNRMYTWVR